MQARGRVAGVTALLREQGDVDEVDEWAVEGSDHSDGEGEEEEEGDDQADASEEEESDDGPGIHMSLIRK